MTERQKVKNKPISGKPQSKDKRKIVFVLFLLVVGLYFGLAGWTRIYYEALAEQGKIASASVNCNDPNVGLIYDDISYCTEEDYFAAEQLQLIENMHLYWVFSLPDPIHLILSAFAFGFTGSLIRIIRVATTKRNIPELQSLMLLTITGGATALMFLGATYVFPSVFSGANIILKPVLQPFLSLFAGVYSEHIQMWLQSIIKKFFKIEKEKT